jgi:hypothetical protein
MYHLLYKQGHHSTDERCSHGGEQKAFVTICQKGIPIFSSIVFSKGKEGIEKKRNIKGTVSKDF